MLQIKDTAVNIVADEYWRVIETIWQTSILFASKAVAETELGLTKRSIFDN